MDFFFGIEKSLVFFKDSKTKKLYLLNNKIER